MSTLAPNVKTVNIDDVTFEVTSDKTVASTGKKVPAVIRVVDIKKPQSIEMFKRVCDEVGFKGNFTRGVEIFDKAGQPSRTYVSVDVWQDAVSNNASSQTAELKVKLAGQIAEVAVAMISVTDQTTREALLKSLALLQEQLANLNDATPPQKVVAKPAPTVQIVDQDNEGSPNWG